MQRDGPEADQAPAGGQDGQRHAPQPLIIVHWEYEAAQHAAREGRRRFVHLCGGGSWGVWFGMGGETCGERRLLCWACRVVRSSDTVEEGATVQCSGESLRERVVVGERMKAK